MAASPIPITSPLFKTTLPVNPDCEIVYTVDNVTTGVDRRSTMPQRHVLIVFVNGLGLPQSSWQPSITLLRSRVAADAAFKSTAVTLCTYDRVGQGLSARPEGSTPPAHDITAAVTELDELIHLVRTSHLHDTDTHSSTLFLVSQSIGVPLARLYCQRHPGTVSALLAIDSNIANTDWVSLMPDPDAPGFRSATLPPDTTVAQLRWTRDNYRTMFHPTASNAERLDRSHIAALLPAADEPVLTGPAGAPLLLTVIGHDPETFAEESLRISTRGVTEMYVQPAWRRYNEGLLKIGDHVGEVVIASGSGHFVQRDHPGVVAEEVVKLLRRMSAPS